MPTSIRMIWKGSVPCGVRPIFAYHSMINMHSLGSIRDKREKDQKQ
jgi:hypothetical protein